MEDYSSASRDAGRAAQVEVQPPEEVPGEQLQNGVRHYAQVHCGCAFVESANAFRMIHLRQHMSKRIIGNFHILEHTEMYWI